MEVKREMFLVDRKEVEFVAEKIKRAGESIMGEDWQNHAGRNEQCGGCL